MLIADSPTAQGRHGVRRGRSLGKLGIWKRESRAGRHGERLVTGPHTRSWKGGGFSPIRWPCAFWARRRRAWFARLRRSRPGGGCECSSLSGRALRKTWRPHLNGDFHFDHPYERAYTPEALPSEPNSSSSHHLSVRVAPNPVRVDIQSTELPFRSTFSDTGPLVSLAGPLCANRRALSLRARAAPRSAGA
jgi:hypothetical protein